MNVQDINIIRKLIKNRIDELEEAMPDLATAEQERHEARMSLPLICKRSVKEKAQEKWSDAATALQLCRDEREVLERLLEKADAFAELLKQLNNGY